MVRFYERWLSGWMYIIDGILKVITLGLIRIPSLSLIYIKNVIRRRHSKKFGLGKYVSE